MLFRSVSTAIVDVENGFDQRIEDLGRDHQHLAGLVTTTGSKLDEFAAHVEASRVLAEARRTELDDSVNRRMEVLMQHGGDQAHRFDPQTPQLGVGVGGQGATSVEVRPFPQTPEASSPDHQLVFVEQMPTATPDRVGAFEIANLEYRLAARPYTSDDRFSTGDPDQPMGFSRQDGQEAARVERPTFADVFRGEREFIADRQRIYVPFFSDSQLVADLGSGRGEFLDLLTEAGIEAEGVEQDGSLVRACRRRGLAVRQQDALAFLEETEPASLDGVFSAQLIEHIDPGRLHHLVVLARRILRQGGTFIAETVNPENYEALKTFHVDLTHQRPIFPQVLLQLCWEAGFESARIFYPLGGGFTQRSFNAVGEYAVVARA